MNINLTIAFVCYNFVWLIIWVSIVLYRNKEVKSLYKEIDNLLDEYDVLKNEYSRLEGRYEERCKMIGKENLDQKINLIDTHLPN